MERPTGARADGHFYRRQVESFARTILENTPMEGADINDGIASVQAMVAIARSVETGKPVALADVTGAYDDEARIFAKTFEVPIRQLSSAPSPMPASRPPSTIWHARPATHAGRNHRAAGACCGGAAVASGVEIVAVSGTYNMIHPELAVRQAGHRRLAVLAERCATMSTVSSRFARVHAIRSTSGKSTPTTTRLRLGAICSKLWGLLSKLPIFTMSTLHRA